ncbi:MAG: hypothetical protein ACIAS6_02740 [Phycisphaerales bacterium JB060]
MSESEKNKPAEKKPGTMRQVVTALVAVVIFALAAVVIYPKFQPRTQGPVRLDLLNGTGASMLEPAISMRVPDDQAVGRLASTIPVGGLVTVYEGMGPVEVESISFTAGVDGSTVDYNIDRTLEPGGVMVLRVTTDGVTIDASDLAPQTP